MSVFSRLKTLLPKEPFARGVLVLVSGSVLGQAIPVLISPVLTRLYSPDEFGVLAVFTALLIIVGSIVTLRYQLAIPLPKLDKQAAYLVALCIRILAFMSLLIGLVLWLMRGLLARWVEHPEVLQYLWFLPAGAFILGMYQVFNHWAIRKESYSAIARTKLGQGIGVSSVQLLAGGLQIGPFGLILGQFAGHLSAMFVLLRSTLRSFAGFNAKKEFVLAKRYRRFPIHTTLPVLLNSTGRQLPTLALSGVYSLQVAGFYSFAQWLIGIPAGLISQSVSNVYFATASSYVREKRSLEPLFWETIRRQLKIASPVLLVVPFLPTLCALFFGAEWRTAGIYAMILMPGILIDFLVVPIGTSIDVLERQELYWHQEISRIVFLLVAFGLVSFLNLEPLAAVGVFSLAIALTYIVYGLISLRAVHRYERELKAVVENA